MSNNRKRASTTEQDKTYGSNILSEPAGDKQGERLPRAAKRKKVTLADNENTLIDKGIQKPSRHTSTTHDGRHLLTDDFLCYTHMYFL